MHDCIGPRCLDGVTHRLRVGDVDGLRAILRAGSRPADRNRLIVVRGEVLAEVAADEAACARDQHPHPYLPFPRDRRRRSASTIISTSSLKRTFGSHPSFCFALLASPISSSTSAGRTSVLSTWTCFFQSRSARANAISHSSCTVCVSWVAM